MRDIYCAVALTAISMACSSSTVTNNTVNPVGGQTGTGGLSSVGNGGSKASPTGGTNNAGTSTGITAIGGTAARGGSSAMLLAGGTSTLIFGGTTSLGGSSASSAGTTAIAGTASSGGSRTGGAPGIGGSPPPAGGATSNIAGSTGTGGSKPTTGGSSANAGSSQTGGSKAGTGAAATGGAATGGATTSGATTGGAATGGAATGGSTSICVPGSRSCSGSVPQLCSSSGVWQAQAACSGSLPSCVGGACQCTPGTFQCKSDGVTQQFCASTGAWVDQSTCGGSTPYCNAGTCVTCSAGSKQCSGAVPQVCSTAGAWQNQTACTGATICKAGGCVACSGTGGPTMVGLPEGYCIDSTEVTRGQYKAWLDTGVVASAANQIADCAWNASFVPNSGWPPTSHLTDFPVDYVDWCDAYAYCSAVGKHLCGKIGGGSNPYADFANSASSEWYNACTSHGATAYPYGSTYSGSACYGADFFGGASVTYQSIPKTTCVTNNAGYSGIYDLSGSVLEWEDSCSGSGATGLCRLRGGGLYSNSTALRCDASTYSDRQESTDIGLLCGIRCCSQ
jgi:sulfatase modifying factor 1